MRDLGHHRGPDEPERGVWPIVTSRLGARTAAAVLPRAFALACLVPALATAGVLAATPAAAIDDPTHPDARVTHGPSCRPGGLVIEVVAGSVPYSVRLATTRAPDGEAEAVLQPEETVVLRTGDVAPGETIDGRLEYAAQDGSGTSYVDELADHTYTRPTLEECALATAPPSEPPLGEPGPTPVPSAEPTVPSAEPTVPSAAPTTPAEPSATPASSPPPTEAPASTPPTATPAPSPTLPGSSLPAPVPSRPPEPDAEAAAARAPVPAGGTVRVRVQGYRPGERVTIALHGSDEVLTSATADEDGAVTAEVLIPAWTATGPASLDVVSADTDAVAGVPLDVAAASSGATGDPASRVPLLAAASALAATGAGLLSMTCRRRPHRH